MSDLAAAQRRRCVSDVIRAIEDAVRFLALESLAWPKREIYLAKPPSGQWNYTAPPDSARFSVSFGSLPLAGLQPELLRHSGCNSLILPGHKNGTHAQHEAPIQHRDNGREKKVLVTILFTDIVGSTRCAETLGDDKWHRLLERHRTIVRRQLSTYCGCEIEVPGDGFLATFDSPSNALKCARAIRIALRVIGLEIRAGLHAGECKITAGRLVGIAVHIAARVARIAEPGQILASSTVRELAIGSGLRFSAEVIHALKGLTESWHLFELSQDVGERRSSAKLRLTTKTSNCVSVRQALN
ncbi:MAG: adenylate/guanylate cyclase domain-containing protein [Burkholderiaceae bacterium]